MSGEDDDADTCVVCFKNAELYSVGQCDHPVCYECSTRMRVLCQQNECPICRQDMPKVVFAEDVQPFKKLRDQGWDRKYKIGFCNSTVEAAFKKLLQHSCKMCTGKPEFRTFGALKDHMRREHELFYCDLCVDNLKIFSCERRCYKRSELAQHRRRGDSDDRSHRGHPLCEFCDERFMDNDELFRHLRRNHLFCHFCDADGYHRYFGSYDYLHEHFRAEHYLCEEGDCKEEKLTSVFRSEIDLKAHRASVHSKTLGKAGTKQARTLELEFTLAPRPRANPLAQRRHHQQQQDEIDGAVGYTTVNQAPEKPSPDTLCQDNFPSLSGGPLPTCMGGGRSGSVQYRSGGRFNMTEENFPALHGGEQVSNVNISLQRGSSSRPTTNNHNLSIKVKHRARAEPPPPVAKTVPKKSLADFPTLGTPGPGPAVASSWKGTVSPQGGEVAKLPEKFSTSCSTKGSSTVSVRPPVPKPAPAPALAPATSKVATATVEAVESKPGGSKAKKKKGKARTNSTSPLPASQTSSSSSVPAKSQRKGAERKCSELKIGELREEQSPPTSRAPPAPSLVHPPGFGSSPVPTPIPTSPPPGFSVTLSSVARPANGLTFTNSCGESFPIRQTAGVFQPPVNFEQRNASLVQRVSQALQQQKRPGGLGKFRQLSSQFRQGSIDAIEYYEQCKDAMGDTVFLELFPELLALLPDIRKQQELWRAHGRKGELEECKSCGQVVRSSDARAHTSSHVLDNHFPALSDKAPATPSWPLSRK